MLKFIILVIYLNGILCRDFADGVVSQTFPIGDPDNLLETKIKYLNDYCYGKNLDVLANVGRKYFEIKYGQGEVSLKTINAIISVIENIRNTSFCIKLREIGVQEFTKFAADLDKHVNEAKKVRDQLTTAFEESAKPDTKMTLPQLICITKKWMIKIVEVYPDKVGQRKILRDTLDDILAKVIKYLESVKGKAPDNCELPKGSGKPAKYKSIQIPFIIAVNNLIKK